MSTVYLIRHGQASFGAEDYDCLSDSGTEQARILGESLAERGTVFDAVCHGSLKRQIQTAKEVTDAYREKGLALPEAEECAAFEEYDATAVWRHHIPGVLKNFPELKKEMDQIRTNPKSFQILFEKVTDRWISGEHEGENCLSWADFKKRVTEGLYDLMRRHGSGKTIAVFTSGGPISVVMQQALGLSDRKTMEISWQIINASVSRIRYRGEKIGICNFNEISHLEIKGRPELLTCR